MLPKPYPQDSPSLLDTYPQIVLSYTQLTQHPSIHQRTHSYKDRRFLEVFVWYLHNYPDIYRENHRM